MEEEKIIDERLYATLSYIILIGAIFYFMKPELKTENIKFHVKQAINLYAIMIAIAIIFSPFGFLAWFHRLLNIFFFMFWAIGIYYAFTLTPKPIPVIGQLVDKYLKF